MEEHASLNSTPFSARLPDQLKEWLPWVTKIRFVIISFVFAIDFAIRTLVANPNPASFKYFGIVIILWYVLGLYYLIYNQLSRDYLLQAYLQIFSDIAIITAVLHLTGDLESNYLSLYLVVIILSSTLLPRGRVFLVAAVSFVCMGGVLELAYLPSILSGFCSPLSGPSLSRDLLAAFGRLANPTGQDWGELFRFLRHRLPLQPTGGNAAKSRSRTTG